MRAYTLGYAVSYDSAIARASAEDPVMKCGKYPPSPVPGARRNPEDYGGGWVWRDAGQAMAFLSSEEFAQAFPDRDPAEFAVYELELASDWDTDVSGPHASDGVCRLLHDAAVVGKAAAYLESALADARSEATLYRDSIRAAWGALDRNDIPAAYDALDVD